MNRLFCADLVLEPLTVGHATQMFCVLSDPAIYEFENGPPESEEWLRSRYARLEKRVPASGDEQWLNWVIRLPTGSLAGYVQATVLKNSSCYIAYEIGSQFWRKGIGTKAISAVLSELEKTYEVEICLAILKARNYRSEGLLRKLDFHSLYPEWLPPISVGADEIVMCRELAGSDSLTIRR